jgi:lipoprotein-releasing system ATP-binding protein
MNDTAVSAGAAAPKGALDPQAETTARPLLAACGVDKSFFDSGRQVSVLRALDLEVAHGERIAIVGHSGVGKSTLLHILGSLEVPSAGKVFFEKQDLFALSAQALAEFRNQRLGFVFQFHYLLADFTAMENVAMPARIGRIAEGKARELALAALKAVGLEDKSHRRPSELSGGQQQLVAVARAIVLRPKLVLADEPTGNLDAQTADEVNRLLVRLNVELGITMVIATHNERLARQMTRILRLRDGRLWDETLV